MCTWLASETPLPTFKDPNGNFSFDLTKTCTRLVDQEKATRKATTNCKGIPKGTGQSEETSQARLDTFLILQLAFYISFTVSYYTQIFFLFNQKFAKYILKFVQIFLVASRSYLKNGFDRYLSWVE